MINFYITDSKKVKPLSVVSNSLGSLGSVLFIFVLDMDFLLKYIINLFIILFLFEHLSLYSFSIFFCTENLFSFTSYLQIFLKILFNNSFVTFKNFLKMDNILITIIFYKSQLLLHLFIFKCVYQLLRLIKLERRSVNPST